MTPFTRVAELLAEAIGLAPESLGASVIAAAVRSRMRAVEASSPEAYVERLDSKAEREALVDEVVVPESWFFREPAAFDLLEERARRRGEQGSFRVLSAGCAGGEEPYSIVLTLRRAGIPLECIGVDALDVSQRQLEIARRGRYGVRALRGAALPDGFARLDQGRAFEVPEDLRRCVRFIQGNLADRSLRLTGAYDAIFCRNVLIYLDARARRVCVDTLVGALAEGAPGDGGLLFAGNTEVLSVIDHRLGPTGMPGAFAFERRHSGRVAPPRAAPAREAPPRRVAARALPPSPPVAPSAPAGRSLPSPADAWLRRARSLADRGELVAARALCDQLLAERPDAEGCYLLGLILLAQGDSQGAEDSLLRTLALDAHHVEALAHLQLMAEGRGNGARAAGFRRRRLHALAARTASGDAIAPGAGR